MRENIGIFRGKDTIEHKWRYGNLTVHGDTVQIWEDTEQGLLNYLVDPETVGQFTGQTDKNGKKIFEGDIVLWKKQVYVVKYFKSTFELAIDPDDDFFVCGFSTHSKDYKIIGNIHDNPEFN